MQNVKTANRWIFPGVVLACLICAHAPLLAQSVGAPTPPGGDLSRPNGGPAPTSDTPAPTVGTPVPIGDAPIEPAEPDKPWSKGVHIEIRTTARDLFLEGNRLFRIPLFGRAAEKYLAALALWKHPAFYFNLALAQLNIGQEVEARESLEHAIAYGEEPLKADRFQEAQKQLDQVTRQLGRIRLVCRTPGAEVTLDGATVLVGPGSYEGWIKAKSHDLMAKKAGYQSDVRRVTVPSGELLTVDLSLLTLSRAADASRRWAIWKPWGVIGAGMAIVAGGGVLHAFAARDFNEYDDQFRMRECALLDGCKHAEIRDLEDLLIRAKREQFFAIGTYAIGGGLIATGVLLLYLNQPRLAEQRIVVPLSGNTTVAPMVSDGLFGLWLHVSH